MLARDTWNMTLANARRCSQDAHAATAEVENVPDERPAGYQTNFLHCHVHSVLCAASRRQAVPVSPRRPLGRIQRQGPTVQKHTFITCVPCWHTGKAK